VNARSRVRVTANGHNQGFAAAVNQGVRESGDSEFILVLNPDVQLITGIEPLVESTRQYGLAAGRLVDRTGSTQSGFTIRRFPRPATLVWELFGLNRLWSSNPVNRRYRYLDRDLDQPGPVEQPAGAFLMFRRDVWSTLNGFDQQFEPVWFEDVDFCRRAIEAGYRIQYVPSVVARHLGGHSVGQIPAGRRASYWCVNLLRYAAKHFGPWNFGGICTAVVLSSVPRMFAEAVRNRTLSPIVSYLKIMRFAGLCLLSPGHVRKAALIV
jgi:N-acetylglucosaminyl-diphospho-decaprenol L-rhamnosyltransferase